MNGFRRFRRSELRRLARIEIADVPLITSWEVDADFRAYDEEAELLLAEQDKRLLQAEELLQSRRLRARRKALEGRVGAARALVDRRRRDLDHAGLEVEQARSALGALAFRRLPHAAYVRRKVIFAVGEAISLAVAFSTAFDVPPIEGLLLSAGIALAFVVAGDLGGLLRQAVDGARLSEVDLDPRFRYLAVTGGRRWLTAAWCAAAAAFALAAVAVGGLRAGGGSGIGLAAAMALLTLVLAVASGVSSWQHASVAADLIEHLERAERRAARAWQRAVDAHVLARYDDLGERIDVRWQAVAELAAARMRLAQALCAFFRARHPQLFGHGIRRPSAPAAPAQPNGRLPYPTVTLPVSGVGGGVKRS